MHVRIRPAATSDVAALMLIEHKAFEADCISPRSFRRLVGSGTADVLMAFSGETAIGYVMMLYRKNGRSARLYSLAVIGDGQGAGRSLLASAEDSARKRGCGALHLEVREDNSRAVDLYERNGYRRTGRRPGYYADGTPALLYEKRLAAEPAAAGPQAREPRPSRLTSGR